MSVPKANSTATVAEPSPGRGVDALQPVRALDRVLDRLGDLLLDDLRAGAGHGDVDERAGELQRGQELLLERRDCEHPENGDHHRDQGDQAAVGETEPGQE